MDETCVTNNGLLFVMFTSVPPAGAGWFRTIRPVDEVPHGTTFGVNVKLETPGGSNRMVAVREELKSDAVSVTSSIAATTCEVIGKVIDV